MISSKSLFMKRIPIFLFLLLRVTVLAAESPNYNVLFVIVDDLRTEIGSYRNASSDYAVTFTPNLDQFAKKSVQFDRAYASVALCGPSRASLLTGRSPRSLEYFQHNLKDVVDKGIIYKSPIPTLPKFFENIGYSTAGAGKVFHREDNLNEFQESLSSASTPCPCSSSAGNCPVMICTVPDEDKSELTDSSVVDFGLRKLEEYAENKKNFFLSLGIRKPHLPYRVPESNLNNIKKIYGSNLQKMSVPNPKTRDDPNSVANYYCDAVDTYLSALVNSGNFNARLRNQEVVNDEILYPSFSSENDYFVKPNLTVTKSVSRTAEVSTQLGAAPVSDDLIKQLKLGYFSAVNWVDELFGQIDEKLEELNLYENTIVVVFGDNGFNLGEQGNYCKNNNFENSAKVPLFVKHPNSLGLGEKRKEIVSLLDLYPTIVDLAAPGKGSTSDLDKLHGTSFAQYVLEKNDQNTEDIGKEVERVAFSGISRCWDESKNLLTNCDVSSDQNVMGYSIRSKNFRYTQWRTFNFASGSYSFSASSIVSTELYDHSETDDPGIMETENLAKLLGSGRLKESQTKFSQDYLERLQKVFENLLEANYKCEEQNCVEITETLFPTSSPSALPSSSPTSQPVTTSSPTSVPTPDPRIEPTYPTTQEPRTISSGVDVAMSAGISIVIMLACIAIAVVVIVWTKKTRVEKLKRERAERQTSFRRAK